jgi:hypothetical protein
MDGTTVKTNSTVTLLPVGPVLYLIRHEHKYVTRGTTVRFLKTLGSVQLLKPCNSTAVSLFTTVWLKSCLTLNIFV